MDLYSDASVGLCMTIYDSRNSPLLVRPDYLGGNLVLIDGLNILDCPAWISVISTYELYPSLLTVNSHTYNVYDCYYAGGYTPYLTTTEYLELTTKTVTTEYYGLTGTPETYVYPYEDYAIGYAFQDNFTLPLASSSSSSNSSLNVTNLQFLLAQDASLLSGSFGLSLNSSLEAPLLQQLNDTGALLALGYSIYYYTNVTSTGLGGHLLLGSVDKNLYTGSLYAFDTLPYEGLPSLGTSMPLVAIDSIKLVNLNTSALVYLYNEEPLPVLLDPTFSSSFLPTDFIINLALQTNAYYSSSDGYWIVRCSDMLDAAAEITLAFGPLSVNIPLDALVFRTETTDSFADGSPACILNVFPQEYLGYTCIGSNFLPYMYMAMDLEAGQIGLASANTTYLVRSTNNTLNASSISSGKIPFATTVLADSSTTAPTFTFGSPDISHMTSIPAKLSHISLVSGHIYVTADGGSSLSVDDASAASAPTHTAGAMPVYRPQQTSVVTLCVLVGGVVVGLLLC